MKKSLCFLIGLFILFSFNCYAGETLTAQQKEAEVWYEKANSVDTLALKIEYYTKAIELDPEYAYFYFCRGNIYSDLGEYQIAINDYTKVTEFNPKNANAYSNRGGAYVNLGQNQKAIGDCTKAIELDPKNSLAYSNRGGAYANLGQNQKAIGDCTKAIELDPKNSLAYYNRGNVYIILEEYQKAIGDCTKAIELDPKNAKAYGNRGVAYGFQGVPTAACDDFYQAGILFLEQNSTTQALICVDYMKIVDPLTSLINKLTDQINK